MANAGGLASVEHVVVLTLAAPRTDDVLAGVTVPVSGAASPAAGQPSDLERSGKS